MHPYEKISAILRGRVAHFAVAVLVLKDLSIHTSKTHKLPPPTHRCTPLLLLSSATLRGRVAYFAVAVLTPMASVLAIIADKWQPTQRPK